MSTKQKIIAEISDRLVKAIGELNLKVVKEIPKPNFPTKENGADEEEFVLLLSDFQIGMRTKSYNFSIFKKRFKTLENNIIKVLNLHRRSHPVRKLNIFLMGDLVQNENILRFVDLDELEGVVKKQLFEIAIPSLTELLTSMLSAFESIEVWCVHGNHGNMGRLHSKQTNLDDVAYIFLKQIFRENKRIKFNLTDHFFNMATIKGWKFLLVHGDTIPMHLTLPWYGITTRVMRWQNSIGNFSYVCMGHFHSASMLDWNGKTIFVNGTFLTDDEWTLKKLGLNSSLCQLLLGVHEKNGVSFVRKIFLDTKRR